MFNLIKDKHQPSKWTRVAYTIEGVPGVALYSNVDDVELFDTVAKRTLGSFDTKENALRWLAKRVGA